MSGIECLVQTTDKDAGRIQHARMLISCPHCQAQYEIEIANNDTVLLCHRCGIEFPIADQVNDPDKQEDETVQESDSSDRTDSAVSEKPEIPEQEEPIIPGDAGIKTEEQAEITPPQRKKKRIWPWLMVVIMLIFSAGFWLQKDAWLDNRWFRSTAINLGFPMPLRDKDWRVIPDSIQAEWIVRNDDSKALLIRGQVKNLLTSELPAPIIEVIFFSDLNPKQELSRRRQPITLQPSMLSIKLAPYTAPEVDRLPVTPKGKRKFVFLIEFLPENIGDFTLTARVQ